MISIVDDDETVREAMARLMKSHGYIVRTFDSGPSLLNSEHRSDADFLIADVQMPEMTGLELHDQLVAAGDRTPTVLITAHPNEAMRLRALQVGVRGYLTKPIDEDDLLRLVRAAVEESEANGRRR
ncbi:response regulator [Phenylobacterium sp.]|uniref:response regulator transcription factor n=1 Tax=Phenylobacterium sp. TaxID=1871053 RepID=UPI0025D1FF05|nr:response regulator [Phenylobacterium sp.]